MLAPQRKNLNNTLIVLSDLPAPPLAHLDGASLFLDFDGTLTEIADTPDGIAIDPRLMPLLMHLHDRLAGRMAIITGRSVTSLRSMLGDLSLPVVGSHGIEFALNSSEVDSVARPAELDTVLAELRNFASGRPGLFIEDKPFGVGLHYRGAPRLAQECEAEAVRLVQGTSLDLLAGKMIYEIRVGSCDKGTAVRRLMHMAPFDTGNPLFIGDDTTDEHGFAVATELEGQAIIVGDRRPTLAGHALADVNAVLDWLSRASNFAMERTS